jgi:hypothetical protein
MIVRGTRELWDAEGTRVGQSSIDFFLERVFCGQENITRCEAAHRGLKKNIRVRQQDVPPA